MVSCPLAEAKTHHKEFENESQREMQASVGSDSEDDVSSDVLSLPKNEAALLKQDPTIKTRQGSEGKGWVLKSACILKDGPSTSQNAKNSHAFMEASVPWENRTLERVQRLKGGGGGQKATGGGRKGEHEKT